MPTKAFTLPLQIAFTAKVIQAGFTNGNNPGVFGEIDQFIDIRIMATLLIRMQTDRGRDLLMLLDNLQHGRIIFQVNRHAQKVANILFPGGRQHIVESAINL